MIPTTSDSHPLVAREPVDDGSPGAGMETLESKSSAKPSKAIRLIVNADDFGRSSSANRGIERAHREGILTSASLMVNEHGAEAAAEIARRNPRLAVGLHVVLVCGRSALKPSEIIGVVNQRFEFETSAVRAGLKYFFNSEMRKYLQHEIDAQFREFRTLGLTLDHVNGHLNFHLHPTVFDIFRRHYHDWGVTAMRLTRDPFMMNFRLAWGRYFYRASHAFIFNRLCNRAEPSLDRRGIRHTDAVFGLLQTDRIDEDYILRMLDNLWPGNFELYCHPDEDAHAQETAALCSPRVRDKIAERGIELITYSDLDLPVAPRLPGPRLARSRRRRRLAAARTTSTSPCTVTRCSLSRSSSIRVRAPSRKPAR